MAEMTDKQCGYYKALKRLAKEKGWSLLSKNYTNSAVKYLFKHSCEYEVEMLVANFKNKAQYNNCVVCKKESMKNGETKIKRSSKIEYYNEIKEIAEERGWKLISKEYIDSASKMLFWCPVKHEVELSAGTFKKTDKCTECVKVLKKLECYNEIKRIAEEKGWELLSEEFISSKDKMLFVCPNRHEVWIVFSTFKDERHINGCRKCLGTCPEDTENKFVQKIKELGGIVIGKYISSEKRVHCCCKDKHDCYPTPSSVNKGTRICPTCDPNSSISAEARFIAKVAKFGGTILGKYIDASTKVPCICRKKHYCSITPNNLSRKKDLCVICAGLSKEVAKQKFINTMLNRGYIIKGEYVNSGNYVLCTCNENHDFLVKPAEVQQKRGYCYECHPVSIGQGKVQQALKILGLKYKEEYRFPKTLKRYDFRVGKFIIEFDGKQHFECVGGNYMPTQKDLLINQKNDRHKMRYIFDKGFKMLRFDYTWREATVLYIAEQIKYVMNLLQNSEKYIWLSNVEMYKYLKIFPYVIVSGNVSPDVSTVDIKKKKKAKIVVINKSKIN